MRIRHLKLFTDAALKEELRAAQRAVEDCSLSSFVDVADRHRNRVIGEIWRRERASQAALAEPRLPLGADIVHLPLRQRTR